MDEYLKELFKNVNFTYAPAKAVTHQTQTDLEKTLSNVVHQPLRLVDFSHKMECSIGACPEYEFSLTAVVDPDISVKKEEEIPFCELDCTSCDICADLCVDCEFEEEEEEEEEPVMWGIPDIERVIFNPPATIVFWTDGTKTVVKAMEGETYEKYAGFAMACMKKMFGSTSRAKAIMNECDMDNWKQMIEDQKAKNPEPKQKPRKEKNISVSDLTEAFSYVLKQFADRKEEKDETPAE